MNEQIPHSYYQIPEKKPRQVTLAVLSFVFSLLPLLFCCCVIYTSLVSVFLILISLLALILGVMSLILHKDGKGFAITGIIISVVMMVSLLFSIIFLSGPSEDLMTFSNDPQTYISEYEETGEIPEEFSEYSDPKYDWFWAVMGVDSFDEFYRQFIEQYKQQNVWTFTSPENDSSSRSDKDDSDSSSRPSNYGEDLITI